MNEYWQVQSFVWKLLLCQSELWLQGNFSPTKFYTSRAWQYITRVPKELILLYSLCFHIGRILIVATHSVNAVRSWSNKLNSNLKWEKRFDGKIQTTSSRGRDMMVYWWTLSAIQVTADSTNVFLISPPAHRVQRQLFGNLYKLPRKQVSCPDQYTVILNVILIILTNRPQDVTAVIWSTHS